MFILFKVLLVTALILLITTNITARPRVRRHIPNLIDASYNICVHSHYTGNGSSAVDQDDLPTFQEMVRYLPTKTRSLMNTFQDEIDFFEIKHFQCTAVLTEVQRLCVTDYIQIVHPNCNDVPQNEITDTYVKLSKLAYLLYVLKSQRAEECCFHVPRLYHHLQNRILPTWYSLVFRMNLDTQIPHDSCMIRGALAIEPMKCEDIRNFVYVIMSQGLEVLQDSLEVASRMNTGRY